MKKILIGLLFVLLIPFNFDALEDSAKLTAGDGIEVSFDGGNTTTKFHVLKNSKSGEKNVTIIFDGVLGQSLYTMNAETEVKSTFDGSKVQQEMNNMLADKGWITVGEPRLLEQSDLTTLGIKNTDGKYKIPLKYDFLSPRDFASSPSVDTTDYWTQIADGNDKVYVVMTNNDKDYPSILQSVDAFVLPSGDGSAEETYYSIRPVITIEKQYITCVEDQQTGLVDYIMPLSACAVIVGAVFLLTNKKNAFNKI